MKRNLIRLFLIFSLALTACVRADIYTASRACVRVSSSQGVGSGIVVGSDGSFYYALTNAHVATQATAKVEFFDAGRITEAAAQIVQRDADVDLAVLKIDTKGYNPAIVPIDPSFSMKEGDVLCTIGHPLGKSPTAFFCTYRKTDPIFGVMFTPPPMEGRSGSPLLSKDGERVVGIVYGYTVEDRVGLAIPAKVVADFVQGAVQGTKTKTNWTPPKDKKIIRFSLTKSILESDDEIDHESPDTEELWIEEVIETGFPFLEKTEKIGIFHQIEGIKKGERPPRKRILKLRRKEEKDKDDEKALPELTGLKIEIGDVKVESQESKSKEAEEKKPRRVKPVEPPPEFHGPKPGPGPIWPPYGPKPWPMHGPKEREMPWPAPAYSGAIKKYVAQKKDGKIRIAQAQYEMPFEMEEVPTLSGCPNGNCPMCNGNGQALKPESIRASGPIPAQILPAPDPDTKKKETLKKEDGSKEKEKWEERENLTAELFKSVNSTNGEISRTNEKIGKLEAEQAETVRRVEVLEKKVETETTLLGRHPIGEAVENGLGAAGENLGKALTVEVGEDVKATLAQAVTTMKAGTEAAENAEQTLENAEQTLENAEKSFTETMNLTQQTLTEIKECSANVTRVLWILTAGLIVIGFLWLTSIFNK